MGKESHGTDSTNDQDNSDRESNPYVVDVPRRERIKKALAEQISNQGSPPTLADFEEETEFTSGVVQSEFGTWSKAVEAAGGNPKPVSNKKSDKELLDEIRRLAEEIGHTPTQDEMNEQGAYSATPYHDRFGSWNNAVVAAGFEPNGTKIPKEELLDEIRRLADGDDPPTQDEMNERGAYSATAYDRFRSWNAAVEAAGFEPNEGRKITEEELLDEIRRLADGDGPPTQDEMNERGTYSATAYYDRFGSWNAAVVAAGFEPNGTKIPEEELLDEIRRLAEEIGHPPSSVEMDEQGAYSAMTYYNRFGSWDDVIKAAGFDSR